MIRKLKNHFHLLQATSANILYGFPSRKLIVIGVTGTDGKTTTTSLIYHILKSVGLKVAMISTVGAYIGDKEYDTGFHVTTPSSFLLQKYIRKVKESGSQVLVLEVTSHALDQYRAFGIQFQIGVLTNVTHEHLDYHKTYERYIAAKAKLLLGAKLAIINRDDESFEAIKYYVSSIKYKGIMITYGLGSNSDVNPGKFPFKSTLVGEFNTYNVLAAIAACKSLGIDNEHIEKALKTFTPPPGRQEVVWDKGFTVMIDFAHTPNAFAQLLPAVRKLVKGRLIHVFGAAGERDSTKRPKMGEETARYSDIVILTSEDPRKESVETINKQIASGISNFKFVKYSSSVVEKLPKILNQVQNDKKENSSRLARTINGEKYLFEIPDRKSAIEFAVGLAEKGDLALLTGKSHEKSMNMGRGEEEWDEFRVAKEAVEKRSISK